MSMNSTTDRLLAALSDRYRIERELGQGGMATVYLAADLRHARKVAIKVLKPELAAVLGAERFVQEIKTTAALSHPHILPLFDSGRAGGTAGRSFSTMSCPTSRARRSGRSSTGRLSLVSMKRFGSPPRWPTRSTMPIATE
jgi:serine/threonine-protein kinase